MAVTVKVSLCLHRCMTTGWMTCTSTTDWHCRSTPAPPWYFHSRTSHRRSILWGGREHSNGSLIWDTDRRCATSLTPIFSSLFSKLTEEKQEWSSCDWFIARRQKKMTWMKWEFAQTHFYVRHLHMKAASFGQLKRFYRSVSSSSFL